MGHHFADDVSAGRALSKIRVWKSSGIMTYIFTEEGVAQLTVDQQSVPNDVFLSFKTASGFRVQDLVIQSSLHCPVHHAEIEASCDSCVGVHV